MADAIDLALLPALDVIEQLTHEEITQAVAKAANLENASPSDPAYRVALAAAYRELLVRQYSNEQARGLMLAFANGPQLDHIGVTYYRYPDGSPVLRLDDEEDADYRARLQKSPDGLSVAGPVGAYQFHAKSAHSSVKDVSVSSPAPVEVDVCVLSYEGSGVPSDEVIRAVSSYLDTRRPLTDLVNVSAAEVVSYSVTASLTMKTGPDPEVVRAAAEKAALAYMELKRVLGGRVVSSGLHSVMMLEGVEEVALSGWSDVICNEIQAPYCIALNVKIGGYV